MKVLIPTSGMGTRLGRLTKYTNKALVKVGDKPVISRIIDSYPNADFVVTLGYLGDYVKQFLILTYPDRNFEFVWVDPYDGPAASLVKSISFAKNNLQCPFILHVCDTILDCQIDSIKDNWLGCAVSDKSDLFRTVNVNNGKIFQLNEKGEMEYDFALIGVQGVYDYITFWEELDGLLNSGISDMSDCHVFRNLLQKISIRANVFDKWFDTGSVENLNIARRHYKQAYNVLDKDEEAIYFIDDYVVKFFNDQNICKNRVTRATMLGDLVPYIVGSTDNFYKYKNISGDLVAHVVNKQLILKLMTWARENIWTKTEDNYSQKFRELCEDFYKHKTQERIKKYLLITGEKDVQHNINGVLVPQCSSMLGMINWDWLCDGVQSTFHGDFILDNILYNKDEDRFILLDWRQGFGESLVSGDMYYDLAKLNHNLIFNHDIVSVGNYKIAIQNGDITCDVLCSHNLITCRDIMLDLLVTYGYDITKVKILTCLIWLNMAPLHQYPLNKFLFYFGKYNLWKELCAIKS